MQKRRVRARGSIALEIKAVESVLQKAHGSLAPALPVREPGERLRVGVRGDSLLQFRSIAKNNNKKTFKANLEAELPKRFGPCFVDYHAQAGGKVPDVTKTILDGPDFHVLCVALGVNDLLTKQSNVVADYPVSLDAHLLKLADAMKSKSHKSLALIGGSADLWQYPPRWNEFMERMHSVMEGGGVHLVPLAEASNVMSGLPLHFQDALHFANDESCKTYFASAWTGWLQEFAGVEPLDESYPESAQEPLPKKRPRRCLEDRSQASTSVLETDRATVQNIVPLLPKTMFETLTDEKFIDDTNGRLRGLDDDVSGTLTAQDNENLCSKHWDAWDDADDTPTQGIVS